MALWRIVESIFVDSILVELGRVVDQDMLEFVSVGEVYPDLSGGFDVTKLTNVPGQVAC